MTGELNTSVISDTPKVDTLEIAMDMWSEPFWQAAAEGRLVAPKCVSCGHFRWPPGPFCPNCRAQDVEWVSPGPGRIFSYTIFSEGSDAKPPKRTYVPVLVDFPEAPNVRILGALVDAPIDAIRVDAPVDVAFSRAANGGVPVFKLTS